MLLTVMELSKEFNLKESKIRSMIFRKEIPYVKVGRLVRFRREDIEKFISENSIK